MARSAKIKSLTNKLKLVFGLLVTLILGACSTYPSTDQNREPATVENRPVGDGDVLPLPDAPRLETRSMSSDAPSSPVVRKLMSSAQKQRQAGNLDGAANSLERAMRIEPKNAKLWGRLADVRFAQGLWKKSIQLANKSNTLARDNKGLRRQNWYLIANAYSAYGDEESAQKYREKLRN